MSLSFTRRANTLARSTKKHKTLVSQRDRLVRSNKHLVIEETIWKVKKYTWETGSGGNQVMTEELWADGNELYDNKWSDRASLTYSGST